MTIVRAGCDFLEAQKKRGGLRLLSRVEVSELRLQKTADPPRPFQLRPFPQVSALGSGPRDFYSRLISRRLSASRLGSLSLALPSASQACALSASRVVPACAFPSLNLPPPKRFPVPTLLQLSLFPVFRLPAVFTVFRLWPFEALASWRLSPGIAFPFRVTLFWYDRLVQRPVRVTCSVPREHSVSVVLNPPLCLPAGRPSGRWVLSNGKIRLHLRFENCQTDFCLT